MDLQYCELCNVFIFMPVDVVHQRAFSTKFLERASAFPLAAFRHLLPVRGKKSLIKATKVNTVTRSFQEVDDRRAAFFVHHKSIAALAESAAEGCYICQLLYAGLREPLPGHTADANDPRVILYLSSYRTFDKQRNLQPLSTQHITAECGSNKKMTLDIIYWRGWSSRAS
jgi:hypothetical protein